MQETIIISLGGSLIVPEEIDVVFLKTFRDLIVSHITNGKKFVIITGGGRTCRKYQSAAFEISNADKEDQDWVGIATNNLNAELLRVIFKDYANDKVVIQLDQNFNIDKQMVIGGAYETGHSSDFDSVVAANTVGAKKIINLSNTDYVYDSDPKINLNAKKIEKISWADYRKIIPPEWTHSGMNTPFDPIASKLAEENGIEVVIMNGRPIDNLANYLNSGECRGTIIS